MQPLPAKLFALSDRSTRGFLPDRAIAFLHAAMGQYNPGFSTFNAAEFSSTIRAVASSMPPGART